MKDLITDSDKVLLIVPCYNESLRLKLDSFLEFSKIGHHVLFADDGSKDGTPKKILEFITGKKNLFLYRSPSNVGKGEVIRRAFLFSKQLPEYQSYKWIGYWDADLATPLYEVENMLKYVSLYEKSVSAIFASRIYKMGSRIVRSILRHVLGRCFATFVQYLLNIHAYDTQCGAKLIKKDVAQKVLGEPFLSRWIFDVELVLLIGQKDIVEYPLHYWEDIPGSKLKIGKEILRVLRDLLAIRKKYLK